MESNVLSTIEINQIIAKKVAEDEQFRLALLNDPEAAIEKEFEVTIPEDTKIEVHVESTKVLHLIIPPGNADELTDDQLEDVAGGVTGKLPGGLVCAYGVPLPGGGSGWNWPLRPRLKD